MYMVRVKQACLAHPEEQVTPTATEDKKEYSSTWSMKKVKYHNSTCTWSTTE